MRYRLQRHDGTDCSATMVPITVLRMVPIQRYRQYLTESLRLKSEDESLYCFENACYGIVCYEGENYLI